jgi:DNA-binding SARP family transcriptional activator
VECVEPTITEQFLRALDLFGDTRIKTVAVYSDDDFPFEGEPIEERAGMSGPVLEKLRWLTRLIPKLASEVIVAGSILPSGELAALILRADSSVDLVRQVTSTLLGGATDDARDALGVASLLGYAHPDLPCVAATARDSHGMPFWSPLERGWLRMRSSWREGIYLACREAGRSPLPIGGAARELVDCDASDEAVELCLDGGEPGLAADLLATPSIRETLLDRPDALQRWIDRLPLRERQGYADLLHPTIQHGETASRATTPRATSPSSTSNTSLTSAPLCIRLFGPFEVAMEGATISSWHGRLGPAVLAYLVLHRDRAVSREVLADVFWRDAAPVAARNRVNVAMHGLRNDLRALTETPLIVFTRDGYRLDPAVDLRVDIDEFEADLTYARELAEVGDVERAIFSWKRAFRTYRDDLLVSFPYEEWTFLQREALRVKSLDACELMATTLFDAGRYDEAIATAERLLALDICREDIHRLIMIAHVRMDRPHRALRQFRLCTAQLRRELGVGPSAETAAVFDRVRTRQQL